MAVQLRMPSDEVSNYAYRYAIVQTDMTELSETFQGQLTWWKKALLIAVMRMVGVKSFGLPLVSQEVVPIPDMTYRGPDVQVPLNDFERKVINSAGQTVDDKLRLALGSPTGQLKNWQP